MPAHRIDCNGTSVSRALRTGREFLLVVSARRIMEARWDKAEYEPGDEGELIVRGHNLGPLSLIVEAEAEDGDWKAVASLQPQPGDTECARIRWRFPPVERGAFEAGHLVRATWDRAEAAPGETLSLCVEAREMADGAWLALHVEREEPDGSWRTVDIWDGALRDGRYSRPWTVPPLPEGAEPARGSLVAAAFETPERLAAGELAWMAAQVRGLDGAAVSFHLERETAGGWAEIATAVATVSAGRARACAPLDSGLSIVPLAHLSPAVAALGEALVFHAAGAANGPVELCIEAETAAGWRTAATCRAPSLAGLDGAAFRLTCGGTT